MATAATPFPTSFTTEDIIGRIPSVRIISVAPRAFKMRLPVTRGYKDFKCAAAPRGGYTFCDVEPAMIKMNDFTGDRPSGLRAEYEDPAVRATHIANRWNLPGSDTATEGSWGVATLPPGETIPPQDLLDRLNAQLERLCNDKVTQANDLDKAGKSRQIDDNHRACAVWLYGDEASKLPWFGRQKVVLTKACPKCSTQINKMARGCPTCHVDLPEYYMSRPYINVATEDPFIAEEIKKIQAMSAKPAPAPEPTPEPKPAAAVRPNVIMPPIKPPAA